MSQSFPDDELLPIRYLNDIIFCERRAALHINEQVWLHNQYTVEGIHSHSRVDRTREAKRAGCVTAFSVWLVSRRLGLVGVADKVEFFQPDVNARSEALPTNPLPQSDERASLASDSIRGLTPYPVEFKRGRRRRWDRDDVQLCAQALCLEEMLGTVVPCGAIYHVKSRQRREVPFDDELRIKTKDTVKRLRSLVESGETPLPQYQKKCDRCSLKDICLPKAPRPRATAKRYLARVIAGDFDTPDEPLEE